MALERQTDRVSGLLIPNKLGLAKEMFLIYKDIIYKDIYSLYINKYIRALYIYILNVGMTFCIYDIAIKLALPA